MSRTKDTIKFNDGWCFATINDRLAEIFFDKDSGLYGYSYVRKEAYSKIERKRIDEDVEKYQFSYRNGIFRDKISGVTFPLGRMLLDE